MKTFQFVQKNSGTIVIISAETFEEAEKELFKTIKNYEKNTSNSINRN